MFNLLQRKLPPLLGIQLIRNTRMRLIRICEIEILKCSVLLQILSQLTHWKLCNSWIDFHKYRFELYILFQSFITPFTCQIFIQRFVNPLCELQFLFTLVLLYQTRWVPHSLSAFTSFNFALIDCKGLSVGE